MSALRHATISAWQRHEDGSYAAELNGWTLRVRWHPEQVGKPHERRGFRWEAEKLGARLDGDAIFEEIEVAMAHAEEATEPPPADPPAADAPSHDHAAPHGH
jgi:hypothetical protein